MPPPTEPPIIAAVLDQGDLETAVGVNRLVELLFRSTTESADSDLFAARVAEVCQRATDYAAGILYQAFSKDQIIKLFNTDLSIWASVRDLAAGYCGLYQTELVDAETGTYPFSAQWKAADAALKARVKGAPRSIAEAGPAGDNKTIHARRKKIPQRRVFTGRRAF